MTSKHFDYNDRCTILLGIKSCKSVRAIAHSLDCSPSSVSRELHGSLTLAHSQNSQMSFMYGFFFVKFLFFTVVCVVIVV